MTINLRNTNKDFLDSAMKLGLSAKSAAVYICLLESKTSLAPVTVINLTGLHRQYVFDGLEELVKKGLVDSGGMGRGVKYFAHTPEKALTAFEEKRLEAMEGANHLMSLFKKNPHNIMEIVEGKEAVIESEFRLMREQKRGDWLDIIGGAGRGYVEAMGDRFYDYEKVRVEAQCKIRFIGTKSDIKLNQELTRSDRFDYEVRYLENIDNVVNTCIRPASISFNIYYPEVIAMRIKSPEAIVSQRALFDILWEVAEK